MRTEWVDRHEKKKIAPVVNNRDECLHCPPGL